MSLIESKKEQTPINNLTQKVSFEVTTNPHTIPDTPIVVIKPSKSWVALNLKELWRYRDLLYILTERDIKVKYKQTILGSLWAIIQPLSTMLVFTLFFGRLAGMQSDGAPYPIFVFAGLLPWTFFSNALIKGGNSLVGNSSLITKVYFPRLILPISTAAAGLLDFLIAFIFLFVLMFYFGIGFSINFLMLPFLIVLTLLLAIGIGMWTSALNVKYRDVGQILPFLVQLWMFTTPIIYPSSLIPEKWRFFFILNPLVGIIEGFRSAILGKPFDWLAIGVSTLITTVILIYAAYSFRKMERSFADVI